LLLRGRMSARKLRPYWVSGGTETCHVCEHTHVVEMQLRCVGCDRGVCAQCAVVVRETREVFCTQCLEGEEEDV
jgi:hypothetical protein